MKKKNHKHELKSPLKPLLVIVGLLLLAPLLVHKHGKDDQYFRDRTVALSGNDHMCSGEQVHAPSGQDYILSAGHCHPLASSDGSIKVTMENGKSIQRRVIAEDPESDLLLLEGLPNLRGLDIAKATHKMEFIRTFTHGAALDTHETDGIILQKLRARVGMDALSDSNKCDMPKNKVIVDPWFGKICILDIEENVTTASIVPGSSGGMAVNRAGELVGVCSAASPYFGLLVRIQDINNFLKGY